MLHTSYEQREVGVLHTYFELSTKNLEKMNSSALNFGHTVLADCY